ncbi:phage holin family protein [Qipengyuania sediminis]|uniref:phage holin family protein n=1 Tax=Qipengyuania sediminis TaxID=1532023 RepID=UPI0014054B25|nr:phage holin family protein [Qipengyuania sediminis]
MNPGESTTTRAVPLTGAAGTGGTAASSGGGGDNIVDLVSKLTRQGAHLAQEQVALMQAEMREAVTDLKAAAAAYAGAAVIGLSGLGVTLMALGWLLGNAIDNTPLGILIVGLATLALAAILYFTARSKTAAANLKPDRTIRTLEDTPSIVTGHSTTGTTNDRI